MTAFLLMFTVLLIVLCAAAGIELFFGGVRAGNLLDDEDGEPIYSDPAHRPRW